MNQLVINLSRICIHTALVLAALSVLIFAQRQRQQRDRRARIVRRINRQISEALDGKP